MATSEEKQEWARLAVKQDELSLLEEVRARQEVRRMELLREHRELTVQMLANDHLIEELREEIRKEMSRQESARSVARK